MGAQGGRPSCPRTYRSKSFFLLSHLTVPEHEKWSILVSRRSCTIFVWMWQPTAHQSTIFYGERVFDLDQRRKRSQISVADLATEGCKEVEVKMSIIPYLMSALPNSTIWV
jgi:hypothetical protein